MATGTKRSPRRYDATRRRAAAEATRARVVASARRLFAERGYGATSIAAIARDAGVSVQTVYAAFTSKRGLLFAVLDAADAQAEVASLRDALRAAGGDPRRQLRLVVEFCVRFNRQAFDLVEIVRAAGSSDPDLAALRHEGEGRRLQALTGVVPPGRRTARYARGCRRGRPSTWPGCFAAPTPTACSSCNRGGASNASRRGSSRPSPHLPSASARARLRRFRPLRSPSSTATPTDDLIYCGYVVYGGGGGIRTHGRREPSAVFKTAAFDRSATPPRRHHATGSDPCKLGCGGEARRVLPSEVKPA